MAKYWQKNKKKGAFVIYSKNNCTFAKKKGFYIVIMKEDQISIGIVAIFEKPLALIPPLDKDFCVGLLDAPLEEIVYGLTQEGYVIYLKNRPVPIIIINTNRIIIKADNKEKLYKYNEIFKGKFKDLDINNSFSAFGINYEYQYLELDKTAENWTWNHFMKADIKTGAEYQICNRISLKFGINDKEIISFEIEPRVGRKNGLFVSINHHHDIELKSFPEQKELSDYIEKSIDIISNKYIPTLITNEK